MTAEPAIYDMALASTGVGRPETLLVEAAVTVLLGKRLDHSAFADMPGGATFKHLHQLAAQGLQTCDLAVDFFKPFAGSGIGHRTGLLRIVLQFEQRPDRSDLEAEFAGMANE